MVLHPFGASGQRIDRRGVGAFPYVAENPFGEGFGRSCGRCAREELRRLILDRTAARVLAEEVSVKGALGRFALCEDRFGPLRGGVAFGQGVEGLAGDLACEVGVRDAGVFGLQVGHDAAVFGFVLRPRREFLFVGALRSHRSQPVDAQHFALPFLPCVGDRGVLWRRSGCAAPDRSAAPPR